MASIAPSLQVLCFNTAISHLRHIGQMTVSGVPRSRNEARFPPNSRHRGH
jgi:hypothetical protein